MNVEEFDRLFDDGVDIDEHIDWSTARRPNLTAEPITMQMPRWMLQSLERQAQIVGVSREALIKLWLAERLEQAAPRPIAAE